MTNILLVPYEIWRDILDKTNYPSIFRFLKSCKAFLRLAENIEIDNLKEYKRKEFLPELEKLLNGAIVDGNIDKIKNIVQNSGIDLSELDKEEMPPLLNATCMSRWEIVMYLAKMGADINVTDTDYLEYTPLLFAYQYEVESEIIKKLLDAKADPNIQDGYGKTILMYAASDTNAIITKLLLEYGADPQMEDDDELSSMDLSDNKIILDLLKSYKTTSH